MPCRSEYMEANARERESSRVAEHLEYVLTALDQDVSFHIKKAAQDYYGDEERLDEMTEQLCNLCKELELDPDLSDKIMFDGKKQQARKLASWWEKHKKFDEERKVKETQKKYEDRVRKQALKKLNDTEKRVLGLEED